MQLDKKPLHSDIFAALRDRIVYLDYPPGMTLIEKDLCTEFGVSRTPVREAIRKLEDMNLVTVIPRFGTHVSAIDINEIKAVFEVKIRLEGLAAEAAARRITPDVMTRFQDLLDRAAAFQSEDERQVRELIDLDSRFHRIIHQSAQNPILTEFLENLHSRCARLWNSSLNQAVFVAEIVDQLTEIVIALKGRDPARAADLAEKHVQYFISKLKEELL